jgi:peroxiredoxin
MTTTRNAHARRQRSARTGSPAKTGTVQASRPDPRRSASRQLRLREQRRQEARRRARRAALLWAAAAIIIAAAVTTALLVTRAAPLQHSVARQAPGFTLPSTAGTTVSLASYRGHNVVLYFNEGVGCDACFYQVGQFEQNAAQLRAAGVTIVPIVMNPASQVRPELAAFGLHTPYLIDATGAVSRAYGVLGTGMHAGLPGHGFVLIDARGIERWYGEYPSMHLSTAGLITQVQAHLHG